MVPVEQTIMHPIVGNCYAACIASIFEVSLESVPHQTQEEGETGEGWARYEDRLRTDFFGPRGLTTEMFDAKQEWKPRGYAILSAMSPRGDFEHAVVCKDGEIVHDPHPQREMGVGDPVVWIVFMALDPSRLAVRVRPRAGRTKKSQFRDQRPEPAL